MIYKKVLVFSLTAVLLVTSVTVAAEVTPLQTEPFVSVPVNILSEAGFSEVKVQSAAGTRFHGPNFYFKTKEKAKSTLGKDWGDSADLVSVLITKTSNNSWVFNGGESQIYDRDGRFQVNTATSEHYISVVGPDLQKVMTLSQKLKVLY